MSLDWVDSVFAELHGPGWLMEMSMVMKRLEEFLLVRVKNGAGYVSQLLSVTVRGRWGKAAALRLRRHEQQ